METNNTITEDEMLENSFPLDDSKNFTPTEIKEKKWTFGKTTTGKVTPEGDTLEKKGWDFHSVNLRKGGLNLATINAMSTKGWLPLDQFENTVAYMDEALNNYKQVKEDNTLLLEALKVYMEIEREYHGFIPVILRPATNAIQSAIKKVENK